jgi:hypothetical protein
MKFRVHGVWTASKFLGEIEAPNAEEAERLALDGEELVDEQYVNLCHQCSGKIDLGDMYKVEVEPVDAE